MRILSILLVAICGLTAAIADDVIVYTCYQYFNSRVYIMDMNGTVLDWFEYNNYRLCDLELVNDEVHVVDAFAPRSFILDLETGDLQLIIDDWSLFYFYDIAYDGSFLYVTEWDMNRYMPDGTKDSSTGYDGTILGSTFCYDRLYTLTEDTLIQCWDISGWPTMVLDEPGTITPPTEYCRGLSFDGENFWTAESKEGQLGSIICFDQTGAVITQIAEPAFQGWSACIAPFTPQHLHRHTWTAIKSICGEPISN
ncbi:MAG: hypothetical protein K8S62_07100 [Candidatus Sabulitectum sp.]|nr:hypothetical protein [Candidatus Sabulitectum sp.]